MENEKRLIDCEQAKRATYEEIFWTESEQAAVRNFLAKLPKVDAVEVEDPELMKAIKLLIKQYSHSKASDYVYNPIAHALYHTWKQVDERKDK